MPRRRKLVKAPDRPADAPLPPVAPTPQGPSETARQGRPRRRVVKKGMHPAIAQFAGYPEAQEKVRKALATQPNLKPTAFSWSPIRMGSGLCGAEAERVMCKKSIRVPGLWMDGFKKAVCSACYSQASVEGLLIEGGWAITLYQPDRETDGNRCECLRCGKVFHGERGR